MAIIHTIGWIATINVIIVCWTIWKCSSLKHQTMIDVTARHLAVEYPLGREEEEEAY